MNRRAKLIRQARQVLPDLDQLIDQLVEEPEKILSRAFPRSESELRESGPGGTALESVEFDALDSEVEQQRLRIADAGRRALVAVSAEEEGAELSPEEEYGLEAIIAIVGRPAILIQNGHFFEPPEGWEILETVRDNIEKTCKSVGRIEISGHPSLDWVGTGFLVAEDLIMTNRHVANAFCRWGASGQWTFEPWSAPRIDYVEELGALNSAEFVLTDVVGVIEWPGPDLALFKVSRRSPSGAQPPEPLVLASEAPDPTPGRRVYVVGYPAWDPHRNDPEIMRRIFANVYGVKRLQPGELGDVFEQASMFQHDCSTLGGNSGSCVVDLDTNEVLGLHFWGRYLETNKAVALWTIRDHPLLSKEGVRFAPRTPDPHTRPETGYDAKIEILDVQLAAGPATIGVQPRTIAADVRFQVTGAEAEKATVDRLPFEIDIHSVDVESGNSNLVASGRGELQPHVLEYTDQQEFPIPDLGRYELRSEIVLQVPSGGVMTSHRGPVFRVVP